MTFFQIADEHERDFEELELHDLERCAYANLAFVQLGHMSARRMTDGRVTRAMLAKRLAAWPEAQREAALADLIDIGLLVLEEDGAYQFKNWDITQFTKEQETRRRALAAERQRRRRQRLAESERALEKSGVHRLPVRRHAESAKVADETIRESLDVTRDVTVPSPSPSEKERSSISPPSQAPGSVRALAERRERPQAKPPRKAKAPSELDLAKRRVEAMFHERYQRHARTSVPSVLAGIEQWQALQRVTRAYRGADGSGPLDEALLGRAMDAYFADPYRRTKGRDGTAPGYSLFTFLKNHSKYDQLAAYAPPPDTRYLADVL